VQREYPYKNFKVYDSTPVSVEMWNDQESVEMHCHQFYEFTVITKGSCIHNYRGVQVPLIPGDIFMIEPNQPHGYEIQAQVNIINCQFYPEQLSNENNQMLQSAWAASKSEDIKKQWDELLQYVSLEDTGIDSNVRQANLNTQGIIHLNGEELAYVESLLQEMAREQREQEINLVYAKSAYLQLILVKLSRVQMKRNEKINHHSNQKKDMIYDALVYIEEHLDEKIDFSSLAEQSFMSPSYFRSIFKDVTGLTPVDYLNRMRIVKSLEYLERDKSTIAEAAAKVGVFDSNYYSRMFKKVMGYSPKYFKSIRN
jgi:YesN/AraC family two-component response regulator